ncbi:ABC transporter permease [Amycolatopsis sp.]|uniref:ABC transporter permease n=1 Tax=Amycolatopsis sp. TaxID=37632 RepID=UPI002C719E80|nr:ABC transporter permease [Amycolatopsis sp.]HVV11355.1 ABC transporter permease [Amycolatopsis sp.]
MTTAELTLPARRALRRPAVTAAGVLLALIVLVAIAPGLFTHASPTDTDILQPLVPPGPAHWFGTDQLGRDVFTRVLYGARPALALGAIATVLAVAGGIVLGLAAALGGKVLDQILMRVADVLLALPALLLALLVIAVLGSGTVNVAVAVAVAFVPLYARLVRAEALVVRRSGYVEASTSLGSPRIFVVCKHIVPNTLGPLLVMATVGFGTSLLYSSALSFFGLGLQPPAPEWGAMLSDGKDILASAWWVGVFPGAAVTITVIAVNVVGRYARTRLAGRTDS